MKVLIDKLGNVLFKFDPADATTFKHKCSLLLPGVAHCGTDTPSLGNLALATQESRNTGNTGFAMTQLQNLPCDMMTSMTFNDFGCLFLQYNSVADSKSCVCAGSSPWLCFFSDWPECQSRDGRDGTKRCLNHLIGLGAAFLYNIP